MLLADLVFTEDSGTISQLLIQFVEQAQSVEKDLDVLTDKDFDDGKVECQVKLIEGILLQRISTIARRKRRDCGYWRCAAVPLSNGT